MRPIAKLRLPRGFASPAALRTARYLARACVDIGLGGFSLSEMERPRPCARWLSLALAPFLVLAPSSACGRRGVPLASAGAASATQAAPPPALTRLVAGNLFDAYAGGGADAIYRGKRYTLVGNVVSLSVDAGVQQVVLGSKLQPVVATGIDKGAALALVTGAETEIEIDCTVIGATAEIPNVDCGPNGVPRPVSRAP
jgi:hypothetical protein